MTDDVKKVAAAAKAEDVSQEDRLRAEIIEAGDDPAELVMSNGVEFSRLALAVMRDNARAKIKKELRSAAIKAQQEEFEREERIAAGIFDKPELPKGRWPEYGPPPVAEEDKVQITIALPPFADSIVIDGRMFFDGHTEWVSPAVYASLIDQMQMSWAHQDNNQIVSPRDKFRQRSRGRDAHLMMGAVKVNTAGSLN